MNLACLKVLVLIKLLLRLSFLLGLIIKKNQESLINIWTYCFIEEIDHYQPF